MRSRITAEVFVAFYTSMRIFLREAIHGWALAPGTSRIHLHSTSVLQIGHSFHGLVLPQLTHNGRKKLKGSIIFSPPHRCNIPLDIHNLNLSNARNKDCSPHRVDSRNFCNSSTNQHPFTTSSELLIHHAQVPGMFDQFNQGNDLSSHCFMAQMEVAQEAFSDVEAEVIHCCS